MMQTPPYFWATTIVVIVVCFIVGTGLVLALGRGTSPGWRLVGFIIVGLFVTLVVTVTLNH
jgi:threonine/homoserine/homoserine lactone efflux protein